MIKLLSICASPVENSSTELLLREIARSLGEASTEKVRHCLVRLNELDIVPCQACGENPAPEYCFLDDDLRPLYRDVLTCDCLLFGSPIYFDAVSAQAKLFIDRCNCLLPAAFGTPVGKQTFVRRVERSRPGAFVLVGGEKAWFEGARRCVAGFFKWIDVVNEGYLRYCSVDYNRTGEVGDNKKTLAEAHRLGRKLATEIEANRGRQ